MLCMIQRHPPVLHCNKNSCLLLTLANSLKTPLEEKKLSEKDRGGLLSFLPSFLLPATLSQFSPSPKVGCWEKTLIAPTPLEYQRGRKSRCCHERCHRRPARRAQQQRHVVSKEAVSYARPGYFIMSCLMSKRRHLKSNLPPPALGQKSHKRLIYLGHSGKPQIGGGPRPLPQRAISASLEEGLGENK